jgi:hypothetical protein
MSPQGGEASKAERVEQNHDIRLRIPIAIPDKNSSPPTPARLPDETIHHNPAPRA